MLVGISNVLCIYQLTSQYLQIISDSQIIKHQVISFHAIQAWVKQR